MIPDGTHMPNLTFEERDHCYRLDGVRLPNVTEILSAVVSQAIYPAGPYRLRGTRIHEACALYDQGELGNYELGEEIQGYVESYKRLKEFGIFRWRCIEYRTYDPKLLVAGTVDRDGELCCAGGWVSAIGDIKSGGEEREAALQTAAYARMLYPDARVWPKVQRYRFTLDAKGNAPKVERFDDPFDFQAWEGAVALYKWQMKKAKVFRAA